MSKEIFYLIKTVVFSYYIIAFLIALFNFKFLTKDMKKFIGYNFVGASLAIILLIIQLNKILVSVEFINRLNLISLIFHYVFLSFFLIRFGFLNKLKIVHIYFWVSLVLITIFFIRDFLNNTSSFSFCLANFSLLFICLLYYHQIFETNLDKNILKEPVFYIVTGIFIGMGLSIPIILFWDYVDINLTVEYKRILQSFTNLPYLIMQTFFIKAYLCSMKTQQKLLSI